MNSSLIIKRIIFTSNYPLVEKILIPAATDPQNGTPRKTPPHCYLIAEALPSNGLKRTDSKQNAAVAQQQTYIHTFREIYRPTFDFIY
jgi:hypothetical protein